VFVARNTLKDRIALVEMLCNSLGDHRDAVGAALSQPAHDGSLEGADDVLHLDRLLAEILGNQCDRCARGLAGAERQMARGAPHHDDEEPATGSAHVFENPLDDRGRVLSCGLEPEGGNSGWQREVVVDGFGNVHDPQAPFRGLGDAHRRTGRVVAANRDQGVDTQCIQRLHAIRDRLWLLGGVGARGVEHGSPLEVDLIDRRAIEFDDLVGISGHDVAEALENADDAMTAAQRNSGSGADHAVDARCGATSDQNSKRAHRASPLDDISISSVIRANRPGVSGSEAAGPRREMYPSVTSAATMALQITAARGQFARGSGLSTTQLAGPERSRSRSGFP
jgi:hypothetical protein